MRTIRRGTGAFLYAGEWTWEKRSKTIGCAQERLDAGVPAHARLVCSLPDLTARVSRRATKQKSAVSMQYPRIHPMPAEGPHALLAAAESLDPLVQKAEMEN